jgi:hypothetical protein
MATCSLSVVRETGFSVEAVLFTDPTPEENGVSSISARLHSSGVCQNSRQSARAARALRRSAVQKEGEICLKDKLSAAPAISFASFSTAAKNRDYLDFLQQKEPDSVRSAGSVVQAIIHENQFIVCRIIHLHTSMESVCKPFARQVPEQQLDS